MNEDEKTIWVADISIDVSNVLEDHPDEYDQTWADQVIHVAQHVAEADIEVLREAFMMLAALPGEGPARGHMAIVGANLLLNGEGVKE